ncbi:Rha family transcriptional regulator [Vagococcus fluvialis]|uniref:Rha family transcriptional regulator n=1 Tax=Vagococcus fluvialis TaxID=2738 RepID=UPI0014333A6E|nr:Rha family transcriptional regulator [Vagococcus fluvialis]NKC58919.1 transcriptional regulator [Vagococcus fluvialis]NKD49674.1 transcriptional regulator [Vagococcus fluvialis]WNF89833.1 Rha family transcriptional regulator [Vagococcus fluvialis]
MKELVFVESAKLDEQPYTTCEVIAEYSEVKRESVTRLIRKYITDLELYGTVRFEILPLGRARKKIYKLNEQQATLIITYLDNTEPVRKFKQQLVSQFFSMKQELMKRQTLRELEKPVRKSLTDAIKESEHSNKWTYRLITDLICKTITGYSTKQLKERRQVAKDVKGPEIYTSEEFEKYQALEQKTIFLLEMGMDYQQIKSVLNGASIEVTVPTKVKV